MLLEYIKEGKLPENPWEKSKVKNEVAYFTMIGNNLYKQDSIEGNPLKINSISTIKGKLMAMSIHEGANGAHQGSKALAKQILR